jgi:hypothetical protein
MMVMIASVYSRREVASFTKINFVMVSTIVVGVKMKMMQFADK